MRVHTLFSYIAIASALSLLGSAQETVLNNNLTPVGSFSVNATGWKAQAFTVATTSDYSLNSVSLRFAAANNNSGGFFVDIYSDAAGPDNVVAFGHLTGTTQPATAGTYTFTASNLQLAAGATYWIVAGVSSGAGQYRWATGSDTYVTTIWTPSAQFASTFNAGVDWTVSSGTTPYLFSITATAIPEPSTYAVMAGVAALGLAAWRRRSQPTI